MRAPRIWSKKHHIELEGNNLPLHIKSFVHLILLRVCESKECAANILYEFIYQSEESFYFKNLKKKIWWRSFIIVYNVYKTIYTIWFGEYIFPFPFS